MLSISFFQVVNSSIDIYNDSIELVELDIDYEGEENETDTDDLLIGSSIFIGIENPLYKNIKLYFFELSFYHSILETPPPEKYNLSQLLQ